MRKVSSRCVYSGVAEVSIYINSRYKNLGVGTRLLKKLVDVSEKNGFLSLQSTIIEENLGSIKLHKKIGFREIGFKERIAKMRNESWCNVVIMERRSKIVSSD